MILTVHLFRDDVGPRHLELEAFPAHHLDQDGELQLAASEHLHLLGGVGRLDPNRHVAEQLALEPILDLTRGHILAFAPGHRGGIDAEDHRHRGLVDGDGRQRQAVLDVGDRLTDSDVFDTRQADDIARRRVRDVDSAQALEREQLRDLRFLDATVQLADRDGVTDLDPSVEHAADGDAPEVVARIEVRHQHLERRVGVAPRRRHTVDDGVEERPQVLAGFADGHARRARTGARVDHGEVDLFFVGVEVDEEVVDLVEDFLRPRVRPVDLVDHDKRCQPPLERLPQHESRLRQRPLGRIHQEQHPVDHRQRPLDLAPEVRVARRIDDIDQDVVVVNGRVLGQDGDAPLPLEVRVVHHPLGHSLVGTEEPALVQHGVDERGFPVVDMGDDGDVPPQSVGHRRSGFLEHRHLDSIQPQAESLKSDV